MYIYTYYYGNGELSLDAGEFFRDGKELHDVFFQSKNAFLQLFFGWNENPDFINHYLPDSRHWNLGPQHFPAGSRNVVRLNALVHFFSFGIPAVHFIVFNFFAFLGGLDLFQWMRKHTKIIAWLVLALITLTPSIGFWSSSIIKEPIMLLGLGIFFRGLFDSSLSLRKKGVRILFGLFLLAMIKPYIFIIAVATLLFYFTFSKFIKRQWLALSAFTAVIMLGLILSNMHNKLTYIVANQQEDFINLSEGGLYLYANDTQNYYIPVADTIHFDINITDSVAILKEPIEAYYMASDENFIRFPFYFDDTLQPYAIYLLMPGSDSKVKLTLIEDCFSQLLLNIPEALFHSYCQPLPHKNMKLIQLPSFFENLVYVLIALFIFLFFPKKLSQKEKRIITSLLLFSVLIGLSVGWITSNAGTIVRYIIPGRLALILMFLLVLDVDKLKNWVGKIRKSRS